MSVINQYIIGSTVLLSVSFYNLANESLVDPSTITLRVLQAGASVANVYVYGVDGTIFKTAVGEYGAEITLTSSGNAYYRWEAGGAYPNAFENTIVVLPSKIVPG